MEKVLVLLSTYNGEKYLNKLLESLYSQTNVSISLLIRDDGSTDNTSKIINEWKNKMDIHFYAGGNLKSAKSFLDLINKAENFKFKYYAFCDQDDIWLSEKLFAAVKMLKTDHKPALYIGSATLVDDNLKKVGEYIVNKPLNFTEALFKNNAQGATMVFNQELLALVNKFFPRELYMHDSWVYQIALGTNARIYSDNDPYLLYRQHTQNVVGVKINLLDKIQYRFLKLVNKDDKKNLQAQELKEGYSNYLTKEDNEILDWYISYKHNFRSKLKLLSTKTIYPKNISKKILLMFDILFNAI